MKRSQVLKKLASTHHGMRKILKRPIPIDQYIRQAVQTGIYPGSKELRSARGRRSDGREQQRYPSAYEILTLNPPIPDPPRVPKKYLKKLESQRTKTEELVQSYLSRTTARVTTDDALSVDDYYRKLFDIPAPSESSLMGQKSSLIGKAYAVAVKQQEIMRRDPEMSVEKSLDLVEALLADESKQERFHSRQIQQQVEKWKVERDAKVKKTASRDSFAEMNSVAMAEGGDDSSVPSVLHSKTRTIEGISLWSKKLQAVPYHEWTIGAAVALDHFIARSVLGVSEQTWNDLLDGSNVTLRSIGQDIVMTRKALFPETLVGQQEAEPTDLTEDSDEVSEHTDIDRSIEELLNALKGVDDEDEEEDKYTFTWKEEQGFEDDAGRLLHELQSWRDRNVNEPFEKWSLGQKEEFNSWLKDYVSNLVGDIPVDLEETRKALLASPPTTREESSKFWDSVRDQTECEIFLEDLLQQSPPVDSDIASFWDLDYDEQLRRLVNMGTLRPILNEYATEESRLAFLERHAHKILEGLELEHIVPDPEGSLTGEDLQNRALALDEVDSHDRFTIVKYAYGSEEFSSSHAGRARALFRAWNHHKSSRARYEEHMYRKGKLGLRYSNVLEEDGKIKESISGET